MNPQLTFLEVLIVVSATLQIGAILFSLLLRHNLSKADRKVWVWFVLPLALVLARRGSSVLRYMYGVSSLEVEYVLTVFVTVCWIVFMYKILNQQRKKRSPGGERSCSGEK